MKAKLETLSVSVLREFAKDKNIKNISAMRKSELIEAIIAAAEGEEKNEPAEVASVVAEDEADVQNNHKTSDIHIRSLNSMLRKNTRKIIMHSHREDRNSQSRNRICLWQMVFLRFCQKVMDL